MLYVGLIDDIFVPINVDPALRWNISQSTMGSRMVCDATLKGAPSKTAQF